LPREFYVSADVYRMDVERMLLAHWHCAGHVSQIPEPGDHLVMEIDTESVIVVRGLDDVVRAVANVCRHRGSRLREAPTGHMLGGCIICPYHGWVYRTDGSLAHARMMPDEFDLTSHDLRTVALHVAEGLMFVSLADQPLGMADVTEMLRSTIGPFGWADAKVVHQQRYDIGANWKLALENQVKCYHCATSHPEYVRVHSQGRPDIEAARVRMLARAAAQGVDIPCRDRWALAARDREEADYCNRYAMWGDAVTASQDGRLVAPLMGAIEPDGGFTIFYVGPLNHFLAYADYGAIFRYVPRSVSRTELVITWLVRGDAVEGVDFDLERLTWLWRVTAQADQRIVEQNQRGVESRLYRPGPYALPIEATTDRFVDWYLHEISQPPALR
jgi:Rieske 2Fe-2S family protein